MAWKQHITLAEVKELIASPELEVVLANLLPADIAEIISLLDQEDRVSLFAHLSSDLGARVFEHLEPREQRPLLSALGATRAKQILGDMHSDDIADFVGELHPEQAKAVLSLMPLKDAQEIRELLVYPESSAGGLMIKEFLTLEQDRTVDAAIAAIRENALTNESMYYVYVTLQNKLVGVVSLRELILASPEAPLKEIMEDNVIAVSPTTDQEDVARLLSKYDFLALPVVDRQNMILGLVTIDDVLDVLSEEATEDISMLGGSQPLEEPYLSVPIFSMYKKRVTWLVGLAILLAFTSAIMERYEVVLETMIALTFFIPMLIAAGGNAGTQAATLVIRGMAVGEIDSRHWLKIAGMELAMGLMLGTTIGLIGYARALMMGESITFALTVSLSLLIVILLAVLTGALLPLVLRRIKIDPAILSSPFITTMVDVVGLLIYFAVAAYFLGIVV
ncbi:MAG: Magnesium transporter MgtE [Firmicutes bacterium]|nr:Magnesium transporter MgtE [candidate division NPL-UPA2 bacterium]